MLQKSPPAVAVDAPVDPVAVPGAPLVSLLGVPRATIVGLLKTAERTAAELAGALGTTHVAVRRHLASLADDGYVTHRIVKRGRGRPAAHYRLTDRARTLFPNRSADLAGDIIDFIADQQGRDGVRAYLRWRHERETASYAGKVTADDLAGRVEQLAGALTDAGYEATITADGDGWRLTQTHCCVYDVAKEHPEVCAYEAATFQRVLGASVSRRETLAKGDTACVCIVKPLTQTAGA